MPFDTRKLPVVAGRNDVASTAVDSFHPDGGLLTQLYNLLIDDLNALELTIPSDTDDITEGGNLYHTTARVRLAISVAGNGSYNSGTGVITISNANLSVDHISLIGTVGLVDTYEMWADAGETQSLGTFTVTNGDSAGDANQLRLIEQVSPPASIANRLQIYASSDNELKFVDENGIDKLIADTMIVNAITTAMAV